MAHVPRGAALIPNPLSGAPGFFIHRMAAFPGIPVLLQAMFPWVKPLVAGKRKSRISLFSMAPESSFAGIMEESMRRFPDVEIGFLPDHRRRNGLSRARCVPRRRLCAHRGMRGGIPGRSWPGPDTRSCTGRRSGETMRNLTMGKAAAILVLAGLLLPPAAAVSADSLSHGWRRSGGGFWGERPEMHEGISENGISVELTLPPGADVSYEKEGKWSADNAAIRMSVDNVVSPPGTNICRGRRSFPSR